MDKIKKWIKEKIITVRGNLSRKSLFFKRFMVEKIVPFAKVVLKKITVDICSTIKGVEMKDNIKFFLFLIVFFLFPEVIFLGTYLLLSGLVVKIALLLLGIVLPIQLIVLIFLLTAPLYAGVLVSSVDKPNHIPFLPLFVAIENGRAKAIVDQGGNAVRYVVNQHDAGFLMKTDYEGETAESNKWQVVDSDGKFSNGRNIWERWIERKTGLAFVGVFPWRRVYHYMLNPIKVLTKDGTRTLVIATQSEISDHVRVREYNWGAGVMVLLSDKFQVLIVFSFRLRSVNPHKLLFDVDNWDESFADAVASRTIETLQAIKLDDLTKLGEHEKSLIAQNVTKISKHVKPFTEKNWGLEIIETQISKYDFSVLEPKERESLTVVEVTERNQKARAIEYATESEGEKKVVKGRAEAMSTNEHGPQASRDQMLETAAKDGQQTMITGLGNSQPSEEGEIVKLLKALLAKTK